MAVLGCRSLVLVIIIIIIMMMISLEVILDCRYVSVLVLMHVIAMHGYV